MKRRPAALAAAALTIAAGLALRSFASGPASKLGGVALWAALVYALVVAAAPRWRVRSAAGLALGISFAVELLQLTALPAALAARQRWFHLVLGETFSALDLPAYACGIAAAALLDRAASC